MSKKEPIKLTKLSPELEAQLPKELQLVRQFYFQLSDEDKQKLDNPDPSKEIKIEISNTTKFCFECGRKINRHAKFCEECGVKQPII